MAFELMMSVLSSLHCGLVGSLHTDNVHDTIHIISAEEANKNKSLAD